MSQHRSTASPGRVVVVGSANVDHVFGSTHLPAPGETILAHRFEQQGGGKGANQVSAAAAWGARAVFVATVGDDHDGADTLADLAGRGVDVSQVERHPTAPTGRAVILVDDAGQNSIVVHSGANAALSADQVTERLTALALRSDDVLLTCGEISAACVTAAARAAVRAGARHLHNAAPVEESTDVGEITGLLIVNEVELEQLTGDADVARGLEVLARGRLGAVVTRGAEGAMAHRDGRTVVLPGRRVPVADTTGAGDAFCGALAAELALGGELEAAAALAVRAGAVAVGGHGARGALAHRADCVSES